MLDLFRVTDTKKKVPYSMGYDDKMAAKAIRNQLNGEDGGNRYVVSRGEDHYRGKTDGFDHSRRKKFVD